MKFIIFINGRFDMVLSSLSDQTELKKFKIIRTEESYYEVELLK